MDTAVLGASLTGLLDDDLAGAVTESASIYSRDLFAAGPDALGSTMAGRVEEGVGEPPTVATACAALASDLLQIVSRSELMV